MEQREATMDNFAKTFNHETYGQILVYVCLLEEGPQQGTPCVRVVLEIHKNGTFKGLGMASVVPETREKDDDVYLAVKQFFLKIDKEFAYRTAKKIIEERRALSEGESAIKRILEHFASCASDGAEH